MHGTSKITVIESKSVFLLSLLIGDILRLKMHLIAKAGFKYLVMEWRCDVVYIFLFISIYAVAYFDQLM